MEQLTCDAFAAKYCERQIQTKEGLLSILRAQRARYSPKGWMLLECQVMDSSRCGDLVILPFGDNNTFKEPPKHPVSPHGLASDMSVVIAILPVEEVA